MGTTIFLESDDFQLSKIGDNIVLTTEIQGLSLLMFYSPKCSYSSQLLPKFKKLGNSINNCIFGIINVSNNKRVILMSDRSATPIQHVPYIVLYLNGQPYMIYNGSHTEQDLRNFVIEIANKLSKNEREKFSSENNSRTKPDYSYGVPLWGKLGSSYFTDTKAYTNIK